MLSSWTALVALALPFTTTTAIQPSAQDTLPGQELRDLDWGDLNILHTTDNHGWHAGHLQEPQYSADVGDYQSFITHMRARADEKGVDLLVVDTGDRAEGNGLWDASDPKGNYTRAIISRLDLDLVTTGNHELYNGTTALNEFLEMVPQFEGQYLSSNIDINVTGEWEPFANRSFSFTTSNLGLEITSFGFLFNFTGNYHNTRVQPVAEALLEPWFLAAVAPQPDLFLVLAHIDTEFPELRQIHDAIRAVHPEVPIQFLAGHAHQRKFKVFDSKSTALESGRYCETAGWISLDGLVPKSPAQQRPKDGGPLTVFRRYIDFNRLGFMHHSGTDESTFDTEAGLSLSADITAYRTALDLNRLIGCAPRDYTLSQDPYPSAGNWYSFLAETLLPEMIYNAERNDTSRMIFINGGSQRFDVFKGPFTYDTSFIVSPFTSRFLYAKDVEYDIAAQLLDYFLSDPSPYSAEMQAKGELPTPEADPEPETLRPESLQKPLSGGQAEKVRITRGYTTHDDFGSTGDDTVHAPIPRYENPKVIQANVPASLGDKPEVVDVVFFDFIAENVEMGLNAIAGEERFSRADFKMYMGYEDTLTKLILEYVGKHWGRECV